MIDYLSRAPARLVAYDVTFGAADTRLGFKMGDATISGGESDQAFADSVKKSGNVLLVADATFDGEKSDAPALPDAGYQPTGDRGARAPDDSAAVSRVGAARPPASATTTWPSTPTGRSVTRCRLSGPMASAVPSLGMAAAIKASQITPSQIDIVDDSLSIGMAHDAADTRLDPLVGRRIGVLLATDPFSRSARFSMI